MKFADTIPEFLSGGRPNPKKNFAATRAFEIYDENKGFGMVRYGLCDEKSDQRIHVCFNEGWVYNFRTEAARQAICEAEVETMEYPAKFIYQKDVFFPCALGLLVPVGEFPNRDIQIPEDLAFFYNIDNEDEESSKGEKAAKVAKVMLARGAIPNDLDVEEIEDKDLQIEGNDVVIAMQQTRYQIKCDLRGGIHGGTGNLFIQLFERNPKGKH
jgi:hypothetical protein